MEKEESAVMRCVLRLEDYCGRYSQCRQCGWWPEEIERRKDLPLVKGENGLFHKVVRKEGNDGYTGQATI